MKLFLLLLCLAGLALAACNVVQFGSMIKHKTGKSPLSYNGYGCYCGLGGSRQPLDATDRCCHAHDCCYKKLASSRCSPKLVTYKYSIQGSRITCGERRRGAKHAPLLRDVLRPLSRPGNQLGRGWKGGKNARNRANYCCLGIW
ncbi:basic phospholipase A2 caudoxin-like isoform X1 [Neopsephotus bourkii]|uniref:basic phospholipase A2 caudoxin-like isoform X1 n=1 Tax=Neopsephotus bourkii TaxID=309878 RepID=UPI002AA4F96C|nr:basic phospholipase A2 caudoxin-like isoform X1 [Neopsephotus bourkii]